MNTVLVTGAPGWLGNTLLELLCKSERSIRLLIDPVYATGDLQSLLPSAGFERVELVVGDLRDKEKIASALKGIQTVFHLAAAQHPKKLADMYAINTAGTHILARQAALAGVEKFIFVSSGTVQGVNLSEEPTDETSQSGKLVTHYAISKMQAEALLKEVWEQTGLSVVIIRPGVFYGIRASANMRQFMEMIRSKRVPVFGKDGFYRSYVDIKKVAEALLLAEENGTNGTAYIVSDIEPLNTRVVYETLAEGMGCRARIVPVPALLSHFAEKSAFYLGSLLDNHFRTANIIGEFGRPCFFVSKRASELRFEPLTSSRPGLKAMAASYRSSLKSC